MAERGVANRRSHGRAKTKIVGKPSQLSIHTTYEDGSSTSERLRRPAKRSSGAKRPSSRGPKKV